MFCIFKCINEDNLLTCCKLQFPQVLTGEANTLHYYCGCLISITLFHLFKPGFNYSSVWFAFLIFLLLFFLIKSYDRLGRKWFHKNWQSVSKWKVHSYNIWLCLYFFELRKRIQPGFLPRQQNSRGQRQREELEVLGKRDVAKTVNHQESKLEDRNLEEMTVAK